MAEFEVNDRRAASRNNSGLVVGQSVQQAKAELARFGSMSKEAVPTDWSEARQMGLQRLRTGRVASQRRVGAMTGSSANMVGSSQVSFPTQRPHNPLWYWQQNNLLFDINKDEELRILRRICRQISITHPVLGAAIDIFSKWPLLGMEFSGKDEEINEFHHTLFIDQLKYDEFLPLMGREYWSVGEAFPLGSFNESLGVWDDDELINPDDVTVEHSPFLKEPRFFIELPESIKNLLRTKKPEYEFRALVRSYPELLHFMGEKAKMPVSNILLKHLRFRGDAFAKRGVPLLYRALRSVMQEEMLNSAQDAISDRLYTPLILARIGASATDLGTEQPWVPTEDQISNFEASLDAALAADFRVLTTHFAVQMDSVFGKETMPNFDADFERLMDKQLQVFGLSRTMLTGAEGGQTYAADALNRDLVSQLLGDYQRYVRRFVRERMLVVAEAQEHYDYEVRGGKKYVLMEEVLVVDEETGVQRIEEQPKLYVPELHLQVMNMKDDETQRQFFEQLRGAGVPISMKTRLRNTPIKLDEEVEQTREEQVQLAIDNQITRRDTYLALKEQGLPIPDDLQQDFGPKVAPDPAADPTRVPQMGVDDPTSPALAPNMDELSTPPGAPVSLPEGTAGVPQESPPDDAQQQMAQVIPLPRNRIRQRPEESDEQRAGMPKPGSVKVAGQEANFEPDPLTNEAGEQLTDPEGKPIYGTLVRGPRHIGARRALDKDVPMEDQGY